MRQITLGWALVRRGFRVSLWCHEIPDGLRARAEAWGIGVLRRTWSQETEVADTTPCPMSPFIVVFDGYQFNPEMIRSWVRPGRIVMVVDDNGDHAAVSCDVILNQNLHASPVMYGVSSSHPHLLLGTRWALIRPEVAALADEVLVSERNGVFISIGGLDPNDLATRCAEFVAARRNWPVRWAGGFVSGSTMSPVEMARCMQASRVGLIGFGTTTWEALCLGLPVLGLVVADNQLKVGESIERAGLGRCFDFRGSTNLEPVVAALAGLYDDAEALRTQAALGRDVVDGRGAFRVVDHLLQLLES